jgi:hypothetical protein
MNLGNLFQRFVAPTVALGVVGGILFVTPQAASAQGITVANQFPFSVDKQQYPAGTYQFTLESQWLLSIRNADEGYENFFPVHPEDSGPLGSHGRLTFYNCEGNQKLQAVYIPGTDVTLALIGSDNATNRKTHGPRPSANCMPQKGAVRERIAKGR